MSTLEENVTKVENAFAAIKTALTGKGVTIPSDAKLSDVPTLVDDISTTGTPALCTFELTYTDGTKVVETTSEGVVELNSRYYDRSLAKSIAVTFDSSAVFGTNASYMFYACKALISLKLPYGFGAGVTAVNSMFSDCSSLVSLTLPEGFCAGVTSAYYMFSDCSSLVSLTLPEGFGDNVTDARSMFTNCYKLASLTLPEGFGAGVTNASYMFRYCYKLASLTLPEGFGAGVTNASYMFYACNALAQILAPKGVTLEDDGSNGILRMKVSFDLSPTALDKDSLIRVIKSLQTVTSAKLTLGTTLLAKLQGDDNAEGAAALALAASKGWTIA
jgi:hypothetical protein